MFIEGYLANKVKTVKLDSFILKKGIERMDTLKVDIGGNELYALKGLY